MVKGDGRRAGPMKNAHPLAMTTGLIVAWVLGYAFTRLEEIVGTRLGGAISIVAAALLHFPHWGWGPVAAFLFTGIIATTFFVWRRDLLANITAHVIVD